MTSPPSGSRKRAPKAKTADTATLDAPHAKAADEEKRAAKAGPGDAAPPGKKSKSSNNANKSKSPDELMTADKATRAGKAEAAHAAARPAEDRDPRVERLRALYNISDILTTTQRTDAALKLVLKEAVLATRATSGSLILIDWDTRVLNIEVSENINPAMAAGLKLKIGEGVTGQVAESGRPLRVGDVRSHPDYVNLRPGVMSEMAVPLLAENKVIGVINVDSDNVDAFSDDDQELLVAIAAQSAKVMHAARLYEENVRKAQRLETLFNVAGAIVSQPMFEDILARVAEEVRGLMRARICSIVLLDDTAENFEIKAVAGQVSSAYTDRAKIPVEGSVIGEVIRTREPLYIPDVRVEARYRLSAIATESGLCSLLAVPLVYMDRAIGALNIYTAHKGTFSREDVELLQTFASYSAVAIVNARRYQRIFRSEELLREAEKFSLLGTLAAEIAHEVRNPLTILSMLTHSISSDPALSGQSRQDLEVMGKKLKHINTIVEQVLDFAKPPRETLEEIGLNAIVEDVIFLLGHKASAMGYRIRKRLTDGLPMVRVNPGQIEQAILNISLNGLQAMYEEGSALTITTGALKDEQGDWVYIRIRDEGCGLPEVIQEKIFSPFYTMRSGGTGLGLFITNKIINQHEGRIRVRSRESRGTVFEILIPAIRPPAAPSEGTQ